MAKGVLKSAGNMELMSFDDIAQKLLTQAECTGRLNLCGGHDDPTSEKVINGSLQVIARDTTAERVNRELQLLSEVHDCVRIDGEAACDFATRFNGSVARYVNHTNILDGNTSRQFAAMLIRNARFSADTTNSVGL